MRNNSPHKKRSNHGWLIFLLALSISSFAKSTAPPQDFFEYMVDFDDGNGEVLDPLEYEQLSSLKNDEVKTTTNKDDINQADKTINKPVIRHTDMNLKASTSAHTSSAAIKGTSL